MQTMVQGYRGLRFIIWLNADRLMSLMMVFAGLLAGAFLGASMLPQ
jgi:hypothetical protein